jgi:hypothetical protein
MDRTNKLNHIPLIVAFIKLPSTKNSGIEDIKGSLKDTPISLIEADIEEVPSFADIILVSDVEKSVPLYVTTYLRNQYSNKAIVVVGPVVTNNECIIHIVAGAQDYFNVERLYDSPHGFTRCLRFSYEREKRHWISTAKS